ncbi:MAG: hypothetical protein LBG46_01100 [Elusimicrobiota bacterium]|nr:hypothetical protein [Elusimicrobiota bacterium]
MTVKNPLCICRPDWLEWDPRTGGLRGHILRKRAAKRRKFIKSFAACRAEERLMWGKRGKGE